MFFNNNLAKDYSEKLAGSTNDNYGKRIITSFVKELRLLAIENDDTLPNPSIINYLPAEYEVFLQDFLTHMGYHPSKIQFLAFRTVIWF